MDKRGFEPVMSIVWVVALAIVGGIIVWVTFIYYGAPYNIREIESGALANQIESCMTSQGYLNESVLTESFKNNFLSDCHLNLGSGNSQNPDYYVEVHVYKFDENNPSLLGTQLVNIQEGDPNIKTEWKLQSQTSSQSFSSVSGRSVNTIVIHSTEGSTAEGAIQTISQRGLSIHYMIDRNGNIISQSNEAQYAPAKYADAFVPETQQAAHAGCGVGSQRIQSCSSNCIDPNGLRGVLKPQCQQLAGNLPVSEWCCIPDYNVKSIGIELVNMGNITGLCKNTASKGTPLCLDAVSAYGDKWENFTAEQMDSLVNLVSGIAAQYNIPLDRNHILGHYQITTDKTDPGPAFNWTSFMKQLNSRGAISSSRSSQYNGERERSFYVMDTSGKQYIVTVLALTGKNGQNIAK